MQNPPSNWRSLKLGAVLGIACALALAWFSNSVISLWHAIGSITAPALLFPALLAWFSKRPPDENAVIVSMSLAGGIALVWRLSGFWTEGGGYWLGVEPIFVGLAVSTLVLGVWGRR